MNNKFVVYTVSLLAIMVMLLPSCTVNLKGIGMQAGAAPVMLDPLTIPKFVEPLFIPPAMPSAGRDDKAVTYRIAVKQFPQQVLPKGYPATTVWGYGSANGPDPGKRGSTYSWPAYTIEAESYKNVRVYWINGLVDKKGNYLPHLFPVDQTLHWANPPGPADSMGMNPAPYTGPVPIVTHLHGSHVQPVSDGYPEAWYLPNAKNIPAGFATQGSKYGSVLPAPKGSALFEYDNSQPATTLWYHDHSLGMTRTNVYAGLAGFYLIRDDIEKRLNLPGPAPKQGDKPGTKYYEIPLVIQDRTFNTDGSLFYPASREFFDGFTGPYIPDSDVPPIWNPEFFGNAMVVNGKTWPYLEVEPRLYRFRVLNGSNSRFMILTFDKAGLKINQIGSDGGLLPDKPVALDRLLMAKAERADIIVDFSSFAPGEEITLLNLGPDEPFGGGEPGVDFIPANPATTGQVMKFKVVPLTNRGNRGQIPASLPAIARLTTDLPQRDLTLNEMVSSLGDFPVMALLGTAKDGALHWGDAITENPALSSTEIWRIINLTEDAHPIHPHQVQFQVVDRTPIDAMAYAAAQEAYIAGGKAGAPPDPMTFATGPAVPPEPWETGWKDTVTVFPEGMTRIIARFDIPGLYVWHCHILEHEDNEMMRPYFVGKMP
ncbi:MAG: multicopper oxidase [Dehalococcoidales bacterium]|nr:multicopper oxidase [Dehalococcoidales bacterium]